MEGILWTGECCVTPRIDYSILTVLVFQDNIQPPMLLSFALPYLPPPIPSIVVNGLKYLQIGSVFLDDIAGLLVAIGLLISLSSWFVE